MVIKCAVVSLEETLLSKAMDSLLKADPDLEVTTILDQDPDGLFDTVLRNRPDVVVLINPNEAACRSVLTRFLREYPEIPFVTVGIDDISMHVYPEEISIQRPAELFQMIHSL